MRKLGDKQIMQISHAVSYSGTAKSANTKHQGQTKALPHKTPFNDEEAIPTVYQ
jgi:hypothetical protein